MLLKPNSILTQAQGSVIQIWQDATLKNCGATGSRSPKILLLPGGHYIFSNSCPDLAVDPYTIDVDSGGSIILSANSVLELADSCKIVFKGENSYFEADSGATIKLGEGASIEFQNGSYITVDSVSFIPLNSGDIWGGIIFEDAGASTIENCTFTGAPNYIDYRNTAGTSVENNLTIKNNSFNAGKVSISNVTNCLISGNMFAGTGTSLNLLEVTNDINLQPDSWSIIVAANSFTGGLYQAKITGLAGNVTPIYIYDNTFNGGATVGLWANNVSGSLKYNYFADSYTKAFDLLNSNVDLYNNALLSNDNADVYLNKSLAKLSPVTDELNRLVWYGGLNKLTSQNANCLYFATDADAFVDKGNNCFDLLNELYYHIQGSYSGCGSNEYYSTHNQWNISPQVNVLCGQDPMENIYDPVINTCPDIPNWELSLTDQYITNMGNGMLDTLFVTSNYGGAGGGMSSELKPPPITDKTLYAQALLKRRLKDYTFAINACKNIIDNYDTSKFLISGLDELFMNYQLIDTVNGNTSLITGLKNYLTQKIQQYQNKTAFVDKAYGYYLKSLVKLRQYSEAIAGYENIINNHPDPVVRLAATWERAAVMLLMNGQSGGLDSRLRGNDIRARKKLYDKDPAHKISQRNYLRTKRSDNYSDKTLYTEQQIKQIEQKISLFNPTNHKEFREKMDGDLKLMAEVSKVEKKPGLRSNVPNRFKLSQNYPNPFNPVTEIKYEISKGTYVSIKIYNAIGQLVATLVNNEYNDAGRYSVKFDGSAYASGIYFYSMETKEFTETKKMILLK